MITYRVAPGIRLRRFASPQPPFWCATVAIPYAGRRDTQVCIDWIDSTGTSHERGEVRVTADAADSLSRENPAKLVAPVLVDAAGYAETAYGRGADAARALSRSGTDSVLLITTEGDTPTMERACSAIVVGAWPPDAERVKALGRQCTAGGSPWGLLIPLVHPATTSLDVLSRLADAAASAGARFIASTPVDLDPVARKAVVELTGDEDAWEMLFHDDLEPFLIATERHVAHLARERGIDDAVSFPSLEERTNWSAAALLSRTGSRLVREGIDTERGWTLLRSAAAVAALDKPLSRIAEAAPLTIVPSIDPESARILADWLAHRQIAAIEEIDGRWARPRE